MTWQALLILVLWASCRYGWLFVNRPPKSVCIETEAIFLGEGDAGTVGFVPSTRWSGGQGRVLAVRYSQESYGEVAHAVLGFGLLATKPGAWLFSWLTWQFVEEVRAGILSPSIGQAHLAKCLIPGMPISQVHLIGRVNLSRGDVLQLDGLQAGSVVWWPPGQDPIVVAAGGDRISFKPRKTP